VRQKSDAVAEPWSVRNGIFGCGDRAAEIAARDNGRPQRPKGPETGSANPGTNGLSEPDWKLPGSKGLLGGGRSPAKPVSKRIPLLAAKNTGNFANFRPSAVRKTMKTPVAQVFLSLSRAHFCRERHRRMQGN